MRRMLAAAAAMVPLVVVAQTATANRAPQIPLREGLTIVTALNDVRGDYESIKRVTRVDTKTITLSYSADVPAIDQDDNPIAALLGGNCGIAGGGGRGAKKSLRGSVTRTVRREDLEAAHEYRQTFNICGDGTELFPGSTAVSLSSGALSELKAQGQTRLSAVVAGPANAFANVIGLLAGGAPNELTKAPLASGTLTRVEREPVPFKVLVNDEPLELPAVHARGRLGDDPAEFWILDDPANPLALRWSLGNTGRLQVIKLSYPLGAPASAAADSPPAASSGAARIERDLANDRRTVVYGIYFDFASDRIKEESEPVLGDIAKVLQLNPTWSLAVEGHTDNIGGDAYNVDLSKRRAAAVKQALVARYHVVGARLQTNGAGASRPKDTNTTLEGRARNRRVELVRLP